MNYLPIKLNKLRKHYSYSQSYIAARLGVDVKEYMDFENGNSMINYNQMKKLCSIYHISMQQMFLNSEDVDLYEKNQNTDELNSKYFISSNNVFNKIKGFIINHILASIIILVLVIAIIILSIVLNNAVKPYEIKRENINRLSVSQTTVVYIEDSGAIGFTGSNINDQLNELAVTNAIKVCEGEGFSVVLNSDGTLISSGLPSDLAKQISQWKNIIDVSTGDKHILALDANGRVNCAGDSEACQIDGTKYVKKVFATDNASVALNEDGSILYKGSLIGSSYLKDLTNIIDIASCENMLAVLKQDKTISVYAKKGTYLKAESWKNIVDVACGDDFVAGLDAYGKVHIDTSNSDYEQIVSYWNNIIAIDACKDYLIGFDGKNIYGVGNNSYNQFKVEEKKKINLEKVSNIEYTIDSQTINIKFSGVKNASGYLVQIDAGTGIQARLEKNESISFSCESMIEGKTYTISIISLGDADYADSTPCELSFVYTIPSVPIEVNVSKYINQDRNELEAYLQQLDVSYKASRNDSITCSDNIEKVISISGLNDGQYNESDIQTSIVEYTYCKVQDDE